MQYTKEIKQAVDNLLYITECEIKELKRLDAVQVGVLLIVSGMIVVLLMFGITEMIIDGDINLIVSALVGIASVMLLWANYSMVTKLKEKVGLTHNERVVLKQIKQSIEMVSEGEVFDEASFGVFFMGLGLRSNPYYIYNKIIKEVEDIKMEEKKFEARALSAKESVEQVNKQMAEIKARLLEEAKTKKKA